MAWTWWPSLRRRRRSLRWDVGGLPVPAELLVYTKAEWSRLEAEGGRFARTLARETVWVFDQALRD